MVNPVFVVAGTRPEAIKLSPVLGWLRKLKVSMVFIWSGQHYDYELSRVFFEELDLPEAGLNLNVKGGSHSIQTARVMVRLEKAIRKYEPSLVMAEGDTNTVVASALTAIKTNVPFAHVEAGLRSYDKTMPEEVNRIVADSCSELLFAPTELAVINLTHEGVPLRKICLTGNTVVDVVAEYRDRAIRKGAKLLEEMGVNPNEYLLLTLHRQENTDSLSNLLNIVRAISTLSKRYKIIFPIHPRTKNRLNKAGLLNALKKDKNIHLIRPLGYLEFLGLLFHSLTVLTDSGGVQEEALTLRVPAVTLRYNTERPETVLLGANILAGTNPDSIIKLVKRQMGKLEEIRNSSAPNPFGDGKAGQKIAILAKNAVESKIKVGTSDTRQDPYIVYRLITGKQLNGVNQTCEILGSYDQAGYAQLAPKRNNRAAANWRFLIRGPMKEIKKVSKK